jgi:hypothetical protein
MAKVQMRWNFIMNLSTCVDYELQGEEWFLVLTLLRSFRHKICSTLFELLRSFRPKIPSVF